MGHGKKKTYKDSILSKNQKIKGREGEGDTKERESERKIERAKGSPRSRGEARSAQHRWGAAARMQRGSAVGAVCSISFP